MNIPLVFIYKFCENENLIKTSGEPREQHLSEVQQWKLKVKFIISNNLKFVSKSFNSIVVYTLNKVITLKHRIYQDYIHSLSDDWWVCILVFYIKKM